MSEANKALLRRWCDDGFNRGNVALADELYDLDVLLSRTGRWRSVRTGGSETICDGIGKRDVINIKPVVCPALNESLVAYRQFCVLR
jgi:hypothetical protein